MSTEKFTEIIIRLKSVLLVEQDQQLAEALGYTKEGLSARKSRGSIPTDRIRKLCYEKGISFEWVMTGKGRQTTLGVDATRPLLDEDTSIVAEQKQNYSPKRMMLEDLLDQETDEDLEDLIFSLLAKRRHVKIEN